MNAGQPHRPDDVRMRGFARRTTVEAALEWLDAHLALLPAERIRLEDAAGRVLAEAVRSEVDVPAFARSMMDGFAVRAADTLGASPYNRLELTITGQQLPGQTLSGSVQPRQAVRIMTGAPLPAGADAVLPAEKSEVEGDRLLVIDEVTPGKHVGNRGEDVSAGMVILPRQRLLRPQDLGLLSSIGQAHLDVVRRPRVSIAITGDELLPAGSRPQGHQIADANGPMLAALARRDGAIICDAQIVPDQPDQILAAMQQEVDIVLVSGGSSVGQEDHAPILLQQQGELAVHGIAIRPSSPAGMGRLGDRLVFLLPGNPVSCLCAYDFFAGRAIRAIGGRCKGWPYRQQRLPLRRKLVSTIGRVDYARVRIIDQRVEPLAISGASILSSTTRADGFVVVAADSEGYPAGAEVDVYLYD